MSRGGNVGGIMRVRRTFRRAYEPAAVAEAEEAAEREAKHWEAMAPSLGFCPRCAAHVNEAEGKLHDAHCIPGQPHRCAAGQNS